MLRCIVAWLLAAAAFALANVGHLSNPGYFSHDELQWGWRSQQGLAHDWLDNTVFQYRPLTFQLWLLIGRWFFDSPTAWHTLWVALGLGICALLYGALRRAGAAPRIALFGAAAFALNPYATYVHGWVATLAELLWTACALGIAWFAFDACRSLHDASNGSTPPAQRVRRVAIAALVLTSLGLLAKETSLAIPALAALAFTLARDAHPRRVWRTATLASALPALVYLALRLPVLMTPTTDTGYGWSLANLPQRWAEFQAWPLLPTVLELSALPLASPTRLTIAGAIAALIVVAVLRTQCRLGLALLLGGALALGPAIVLATGYPQYGYAASALAWACIAFAWPGMRAWGRAIVLVALLGNAWHGVNVQREMLRVGRLEANFTPTLHPLIEQSGKTLLLAPTVTADDWVYRRLTQSLPNAQREVRVQLHTGDVQIAADGTVHHR